MHYSSYDGQYYDSRFLRHFAMVEGKRDNAAKKLVGYWAERDACTDEELAMMVDALGEFGMDLGEEYGVFIDGVWSRDRHTPLPVTETWVEEEVDAWGRKTVRTTIRRTDECGDTFRTTERSTWMWRPVPWLR